MSHPSVGTAKRLDEECSKPRRVARAWAGSSSVKIRGFTEDRSRATLKLCDVYSWSFCMCFFLRRQSPTVPALNARDIPSVVSAKHTSTVSLKFWTAPAERQRRRRFRTRDDVTQFEYRPCVRKRRGAALPAAVQDGVAPRFRSENCFTRLSKSQTQCLHRLRKILAENFRSATIRFS